MKDSVKADLLRNAPLFSELSEDNLRELIAIARVVNLKKGQNLFLVGEPALRLYVIASGTIRAFRVNAAGREQVIHVEKAGATLAEVAIFDDGPYPANAAAEEDSVLLSLERSLLIDFIFRHPEVAWSALRIMAARLRRHADLIDQLALQEVVPRLAQLILAEAEDERSFRDTGIVVTLPLSHQQLASRIGTVREVVSRSLSRLEKNGVIRVTGRTSGARGTTLLIEDVKTLREYAAGYESS